MYAPTESNYLTFRCLHNLISPRKRFTNYDTFIESVFYVKAEIQYLQIKKVITLNYSFCCKQIVITEVIVNDSLSDYDS